MTRLYLIRHCESFGNIHRRIDGIRDTNITQKGENQLKLLQNRVKHIKFDAIYTSDLQRSRKTAGAVSYATNGPKVQVESKLQERRMGIFEGGNWHQLRQQYPEIFNAWRSDTENYVIPKGESEIQALERFKETLLSLCAHRPEGTIAVISHSMVIQILQMHVLDKCYIPYGDNTAISLFQVEAENKLWHEIFLNDITHLSTETVNLPKVLNIRDSGDLEGYSLRFEKASCEDMELPDYFDTGETTIKGYQQGVFVSALSYRVSGNICELIDVYTLPRERCRGYATQLIGEVLYRENHRTKEMRFIGSTNIEMECLLKKNGFSWDNGLWSLYPDEISL